MYSRLRDCGRSGPSRAGRYRHVALTLALIVATFAAMWLLR